jgi:hypothetical protein
MIVEKGCMCERYNPTRPTLNIGNVTTLGTPRGKEGHSEPLPSCVPVFQAMLKSPRGFQEASGRTRQPQESLQEAPEGPSRPQEAPEGSEAQRAACKQRL